MKLQERLKNLRPYVVGLRFIKGDKPVVDVKLDETWTFIENSKIVITKSNKVKDYYMVYSDDPSVEIDELLDFIELFINYNKELEEKSVLLKLYTGQLQQLFGNTTFEQFKRLEMIISPIDVSLEGENSILEGSAV